MTSAPAINTVHSLYASQEAKRVAMGPETAKFLSYVDKRRSEGLIDIKFFKADVSQSTKEDFFKEVNEMLASPVVEDNRVL